MKRSVLAFAMTLMLALSLTACSNRGTNGGNPGASGTGTPNTTGTNGANGTAARTAARDNTYAAGDYYASDDGVVGLWDDGDSTLARDARRVMDGVADGVTDVGRDARNMVYDLTME